MPTATGAELEDLLTRGDLTPVGRVSGSSNGALLCVVGDPLDRVLVIHKPEATERPLWDYPDGTLVARERAAWLVSEAGGFDVVPPTVLREGPLGRGSVQLWVGPLEDDPNPLVAVVDPDEVPDGWFTVLEGETPLGEPVLVVHSDEPALRTVAVFDAAINNSDRKGGHLLREDGVVRGCDHGVSLGVEPKLRTVLWGWAGEPLADSDRERLARLAEALGGPLEEELEPLLTVDEVEALRMRVAALCRRGHHPVPHGGWPAIPWPAL
ncbi:SCO1664 family protein [Phycicoccus sp. CSK15P-2]|uniref:SCO1664 family protein n=1 Tax=Phycicoccus sp. CSK15P-2 TaxID=2807627 RepID=UPI001951ECD8|nr:SCO1664 family protein [Phycicoccus sp. CSK15P-2]MBM6405829.1 SCO1664 family protein [Phycicoccus sp. CSK15P-2]